MSIPSESTNNNSSLIQRRFKYKDVSNGSGSSSTNGINSNDRKKSSLQKLHSSQIAAIIIIVVTLIILLVVAIELITSSYHTNSNDAMTTDSWEDQIRRQVMPTTTNNNRTIAYVVTITSCNGHERDATFQIVEGASVLRHSIHMNSIRTKTTKTGSSSRSQYDYQLFAFYHPDAVACAIPLLNFGYIIESRETPVNVSDIGSTELRERIVHNGCCGEKELIKLEAFTLTQYPLVVLLDIDVLIVQPLDRLFDFMMNTSQLPNDDDLLYYPNKPALAGRNTNVTIPTQVDLLYTTDYAMVSAQRYIKPVQGGFVILRPNHTVYTDFVQIVQTGDFQFDGNTDLGWGGRTGRFWGAMTFQGLMPYYFQILYPHRALELNWCRWNNMCSPSYDDHDKKKTSTTKKVCMTQQENCEDCQLRSIENINLIHYTVCQKPWLCQLHHQNSNEHKLCRTFHHEWFKVRSAMELSWGRSGMGPATYQTDHFLGYCKSHGQQGYVPLQKPYGLPLLTTGDD